MLRRWFTSLQRLTQGRARLLFTVSRRFIHPAAREGDQAACAHTTRAPAHPFQRGGVLAYGLRWGMMDSDRAELGLVCEAAGWMGLVGGGGEGGRRGCPMAHTPRRQHREGMPSQRHDLPLGRLPQRDDAAGG